MKVYVMVQLKYINATVVLFFFIWFRGLSSDVSILNSNVFIFNIIRRNLINNLMPFGLHKSSVA